MKCNHLILKVCFLIALPLTSLPSQTKRITPYVSDGSLAGYKLVWHDEFGGKAVNTNDWNYRTGERFWSTQRPENVSVADGKLRLALKKEKFGNTDYTAGGLISKREFKFGYYEARIKMPRGKGWHTSFWMMRNGEVETREQELDVCEQDSINPNDYSTNVHGYKPTHRALGAKHIATPDLTADFHVWGCEFTATTVTYYFDGKVVDTRDVTNVPLGDASIWLTSIAAPLGKTDKVDDSVLPAYAEFDYVRFFEKAPATKISGRANPAAKDDLAWLQSYNVVWTSQSRNAAESMPCGGGDTGLNFWVENGELLCYVQRSGAFDENNQYLKLGRLRVRLEPNPFADGGEFRQELKLREGFVEITGKHGALQAQLSVWADVFNPVVHIEVKANQPVQVVAAYENWRQADVSLPNSPARPRFAALGWDGYPGEVTRFRDEVNFQGDAVLFYHRNRDDRLLIDYAIRQQGLEAVKDQIVNPQKGRTFGGLLRGAGFVVDGTAEGKYVDANFKAWKLRSRQAAASHHLELVSHIAQTDTLAQWQAGLNKNAQAAKVSPTQARQRTRNWWQQFWQRSRIIIAPHQPNESNKAWQIARNYQLFRYQLGCNAFGEYPTKFNGGNFTFDPSLVEADKNNDADWRAWGGGSFTAQNQRLVHWPMLKAGDTESVKPQLEMYRRTLPSATARVKTYYGHEGALFTEHLETFGLPISAGWGWAEAGAKTRQRGQEIPFGDPRADATHGPNSLVERGEQANAFVSYHYESQLEFSYLALEHHRWFGGDIRPYLPLIRQSVKFFDEHYQLREKMRSGKPLDERGKLVIYPSTSLESYRGARNPADLIAGLHACLDGLLMLDDKLIPPAEKQYYREFLTRVPDYTFGAVNGDRILEPAANYHHYQNVECPQFYPLFPFNQFALGRDDMQLFRATWKHGKFPKNMVQSWHQDGIFYARMGMTKEAAEYNTRKLENAPRRFPTFWGPGHDWVPDHNWGGSGMIGLQEMLLQTIGDRILLLPAWPKDWDVDFKLHAPKNTVVEVRYRNGKIENLIVTPASRRKNVVIANSSLM
jgi:hypothetical protein